MQSSTKDARVGCQLLWRVKGCGGVSGWLLKGAGGVSRVKEGEKRGEDARKGYLSGLMGRQECRVKDAGVRRGVRR